MNNIKNYTEYNKVNEELQIFGMDVVITLGELVGAATTIFSIAAVGAFFGYMSLKSWLSDILSDKKRVKALKRLSILIEKYRDEVVDGYIHNLKTYIHYVKTHEQNKKIENDYTELANHLRDKMTEEDKVEYDSLMDEIGMWGDSYKMNKPSYIRKRHI